jgi:hypothetical protein
MSELPDPNNAVRFSCQFWLSDRRLPDNIPHPNLEFSHYWSIDDVDPKAGGKRFESYANIKLGDPNRSIETMQILKDFFEAEILNQPATTRIILNVTIPSTMISYLLPKEIMNILQALKAELNIRLI